MTVHTSRYSHCRGGRLKETRLAPLLVNACLLLGEPPGVDPRVTILTTL